MTNNEIDSIVYECRKRGDDTTYSIVRAALAGTAPASSKEYAETVLQKLDALQDDAAAHIFPSDLHKCMTSECAVEVASVRMGSPSESTVPLFSREQVVEALSDATHALRTGGKNGL